MGAKDIPKSNYKYLIESIMRWLLFGVLFVVFIPVLDTWYKLIIGKNVSYMECMPDVLLATLSVCCNFLNICVDTQKKVAYVLRWIFGLFSGGHGLYCLYLYRDIRYNQPEITELVLKKMFENLSVVIIICLIVGAIIEAYSNIDDRR